MANIKTKSNTFPGVNSLAGFPVHVYNTSYSLTDYERLVIDWSSNVARIWTQNDGTGSPQFMCVGASRTNGAASPAVRTYWSGGSSVPYIRHAIIPATVSVTGVWHELASYAMSGSTAGNPQIAVGVSPAIGQSGGGSYVALEVNPTESSVGSGRKLLQRWAVGNNERAAIDNNGNFEAVTVKTAVTTVAALPTAGIQPGTRAMVNDALADTFGSIVAGGGSIMVPVYFNGSNWIIG